MIKNLAVFIVLIIFSLTATSVYSAMSSTNYRIDWDSINSGGSDNSTSTSYSLTDSMGQSISGESTSTNFNLNAGYQQSDEEIQALSFTVGAQNNNIKTTYTAFSTDYTVIVATTTGFSVDDYIGVIENSGANQLVSIGKITQINDDIITVDKWSGDYTSMTSTPSGGDDFVYSLVGNSIPFENMDYNKVNTGLAFFEVKTMAQSSGYSVFIREDTNLKSGDDEINDVSDGTVSANTEEYGIETVGDGAQGSGDWAIISDKQLVANVTGTANNKRTGVIHKLSVDGTTSKGLYQHTVSYYCTVNY